jgi:XTP/dITP diphosphohydrolase
MLIATTNLGKIREIRLALAQLPVQLITLGDLPRIAEPDETGRTFAENALLKANYYAQAGGVDTVAEDSGLVIDALGGRPGVESARYPGATYADKFANLYQELAGHPRPWTARYVCAVACVSQAPAGRPVVLFTVEGRVEGEIAPEPRGSSGFGYDPIFFYPPYGMTLGEASDEAKLAISHRGAAFRQFAAWVRARSPGVRARRPD